MKTRKKMRDVIKDFVLLLRAIPSPVVALFVISVIAMNILANKTIIMTTYIAIDGGILISWLSFLSMDVVTKHFGPRASTKLSIFAIFVNLLTCLIFFIVSIIPGASGEDYTAFNTIIGGTWFILLSSTIAFLASAIINNFMHFAISKKFKDENSGISFLVSSYLSTFLGQFFDNLIFSILTFMIFAPIFWDGFHWTFVQCITCACLGAVVELVMEIVFSPFGLKIVKRWEKEGVGKTYLENKEEGEK
jgi:hypothetical protein